MGGRNAYAMASWKLLSVPSTSALDPPRYSSTSAWWMGDLISGISNELNTEGGVR